MKGSCEVNFINHVGVAIRDMEQSLEFFWETFGIRPSEVVDMPDQGVQVSLLSLGETRLELLQPLGSDTSVGRFIERRGEGLHHLAFNVGDASRSLECVKAKGLDVIDEVPRIGVSGLIAFIQPRSVHGILTELVETV